MDDDGDGDNGHESEGETWAASSSILAAGWQADWDLRSQGVQGVQTSTFPCAP